MKFFQPSLHKVQRYIQQAVRLTFVYLFFARWRGLAGRKIFPSEENFARFFGFALFANMYIKQQKNMPAFAKKNARSLPATLQS